MKTSINPYAGYRYPPEIIAHAVSFITDFALSLRDGEELSAERGVIVRYETIRQWCCTTFGGQSTKVAGYC